MNLLQMSFSAAVLIIAVVILRALTLYKLPKKTFFVLWGVVICRLLIPFSIPSRLSFYTGMDMIKRAFAETAHFIKPAVSTDIPAITINTGMLSMGVADMEKFVDSGTSTILIPPLMLIWLIGMCFCAMFFIVTYIKCRREFKTALPVKNNFIALWQQTHPIRLSVQIKQSDRIKAPLTYGVFRPVLLLPKVMEWTDETKLQYILTHEYVHIKRFDGLTKLLMTSALCIHWFNPLVWLMYVLANRDIELSCDEAVVRTFGETMRSAYALTLIGLEEKKSRLTPLCNNFSKNAVEERITAIMKIKKYSLPIIVVAVLLVAGVTVGFLTSNAKAYDDPNPQDNTKVLTTTSHDNLSKNIPVNTEVQPNRTPDNINISNLSWVWPVEGCDTVTSAFGKRFHRITGEIKYNDSINISGNGVEGAHVYAALTGTISKASFDNEHGNYVVISHDGGIETVYRHLGKLQVSAGDTVSGGDMIGTVGKTGTATGPFLAFCVYVNGTAVNPLDYYK